MAERSDQRTRSADEDPLVEESGLGLDGGPTVDDAPAPPSGSDQSRGIADRLRAPFSAAASRATAPFEGLFAPRSFLLLFVLSVAGMFVAGAALPLGSVAGLLGLALVAFGAGLVGERRQYAEVVLSSGLAAGISWFLGNLVLTALGPGVPLVAVGVGAGALVGAVGHYFGRDLRAGLTRDI